MFFTFVYLIFLFIGLAPAIIAIVYFIMGAKSYWIGKKENSQNKITSGYRTMGYSFIALLVILAIYYFLLERIPDWDM